MTTTTTTITTSAMANLRRNKIRLGSHCAGDRLRGSVRPCLRDGFKSNRHRTLSYCLGMIPLVKPKGCFSESRFALCGSTRPSPGPDHALARMMGPNVGLRDPHALQHTAKINTSEIAYLNCDEASH